MNPIQLYLMARTNSYFTLVVGQTSLKRKRSLRSQANAYYETSMPYRVLPRLRIIPKNEKEMVILGNEFFQTGNIRQTFHSAFPSTKETKHQKH
jgi:hypothetical protein